MSDDTSSRAAYKVREAHERLDEHEEVHESFDRRISKNENWRLQAQGALKVIGIILGAGGLAAVFDAALGLF